MGGLTPKYQRDADAVLDALPLLWRWSGATEPIGDEVEAFRARLRTTPMPESCAMVTALGEAVKACGEAGVAGESAALAAARARVLAVLRGETPAG